MYVITIVLDVNIKPDQLIHDLKEEPGLLLSANHQMISFRKISVST